MSLREEKITQLIPHCGVLCDCGCDHGYIGEKAISEGIVKKVIFVDLSAPSLEKARKLCLEKGHSRCEFLCQDGLGDIKTDAAVIAGMGGLEIIDIISRAKYPPSYLILSPQRNVKEVRQELCKNYKTVKDFVIYDKKFYDLMLLQRGEGENLSKEEILFGRTNLREFSQDFKNYLLKEKKVQEKILSQARVAEKEEWLKQVCLILEKGYEKQY